jgi:hypothetical protein
MSNNDSVKQKQMFHCEKCDYSCAKNSDYIKHSLTLKHINNKTLTDIVTHFECENCKKIYMSGSGLWKHSKKCKTPGEIINEPKDKVIELLIKEITDFKQMVMELLKSNSELQKHLVEDLKKNNNVPIEN